MMLRLALLFEPGIVITNVPYQVGENGQAARGLPPGLSGTGGTVLAASRRDNLKRLGPLPS